MPQIGANYTNESAAQIQARELNTKQVQNEVQLRNLLIAANSTPGNAAVAALVTANISAAQAAGYLIEISPSLTIDSSGNVSSKHK